VLQKISLLPFTKIPRRKKQNLYFQKLILFLSLYRPKQQQNIKHPKETLCIKIEAEL